MIGSTFKRCECPTEYDARGRAKNCPKKHGSWSIKVELGKDATGKRVQRNR